MVFVDVGVSEVKHGVLGTAACRSGNCSRVLFAAAVLMTAHRGIKRLLKLSLEQASKLWLVHRLHHQHTIM